MTDDQIKHMVDRFLHWKLPHNFSPDAGISYTRLPYHDKTPPSGTNLFDATQATEMIRYMVEGFPECERCDTSCRHRQTLEYELKAAKAEIEIADAEIERLRCRGDDV